MDSSTDSYATARRWPAWIALPAIMAIAFALRAWQLDQRSIWFDEAFTWRLSTYPWTEIIDRSTLDNHPPLHFVVLKLWMSTFGDSAFALRMLSVLCGTAASAGMYLVMVEAYGHPRRNEDDAFTALRKGRWLGLCTAVFVAVSVMQIRWSCEVRSYALGAALAAGSSWLLLRSLRLDSWRSWMAYVALAIAFAYTHPYALFTLIAQAIFVIGTLLGNVNRTLRCARTAQRSVPATMRALVAGTLVFAGWLTWLPALLEQRAHVHRDLSGWPVNHWCIPESCYQLWIEPQDPCLNKRDNLIAAVVCAAILLALFWRPEPGDWFLLLSAVVPPALALIVTVLDTPIYHSHFLLFAQLFLLAALARLVGRIPREPERSAVAGVVALNLLFVYVAWQRRVDIGHKPGVRAAVAAIERSRQPGEPVAVTSPFYFPSVLFYLHDRTNCHLLDDGQRLRHYEGTAVLTPDDFIDLQRLLAGRPQRIWAVNVDSPRTSWRHKPLGLPAPWREVAKTRFEEVYYVQGAVEVVEYRAGGPPEASNVGGRAP